MRNSKSYYRQLDETMKILQYEHGTLPITRKILYKYERRLKWDNIVCHQKLTEAMIEDFQQYMDWGDICRFQTLSEDFIRKHYKDVDWVVVTRHQNLSTEFIREFQDYVDWKIITYKYPLGDNFIDEFHKKIDWTILICDRVHMIDFTWVEMLKKRFNVIPIQTYSGYLWKEKED